MGNKKQYDYINDWKRQNNDRISVLTEKGKKDLIKEHASNQGESLNAFINRAIDNQIILDQKTGSEKTNQPTQKSSTIIYRR